MLGPDFHPPPATVADRCRVRDRLHGKPAKASWLSDRRKAQSEKPDHQQRKPDGQSGERPFAAPDLQARRSHDVGNVSGNQHSTAHEEAQQRRTLLMGMQRRPNLDRGQHRIVEHRGKRVDPEQKRVGRAHQVDTHPRVQRMRERNQTDNEDVNLTGSEEDQSPRLAFPYRMGHAISSPHERDQHRGNQNPGKHERADQSREVPKVRIERTDHNRTERLPDRCERSSQSDAKACEYGGENLAAAVKLELRNSFGQQQRGNYSGDDAGEQSERERQPEAEPSRSENFDCAREPSIDRRSSLNIAPKTSTAAVSATGSHRARNTKDQLDWPITTVPSTPTIRKKTSRLRSNGSNKSGPSSTIRITDPATMSIMIRAEMSCAVRVGTSQQFLGPAFGEHVATVRPPQGLPARFFPRIMFV